MYEEAGFVNLSQQSLAGEKSMMCNGYMLDLPTHNRQVKGILCFILLNSQVALPQEWTPFSILAMGSIMDGFPLTASLNGDL
ncbi:hypothetical protein [Legionella bozemanae]|uniref:hypothetical protein n=1 Tax=Legionella bozemanae TaxID=447 RepID=UPI00399C961E